MSVVKHQATHNEFLLRELHVKLYAPLTTSDRQAISMIDSLSELKLGDRIDDFVRGLSLPEGLSTIAVEESGV